jgi:V/A-type H+-transporting ATPase subunit E
MALDKVIEDILASARKDADQLVSSAEKERDVILRQADENIAARRKAQDKKIAESVKRLRQQEISSAELESKRILLNARKEALDEVLASVKRQLVMMTADQRADAYAKILAQGLKVIPGAKTYCPRGDAKLLRGGAGTSVEERDMEPGLIVESKDGKVSLDFRFSTILESVWEKELKNVSKMLFG